MMASASELSLKCKPHAYSMLLKTIGDQQQTIHGHDQTQKLEEFLARLEEERLKIDAFKRELPLCMQLLTNAMETSRQQLQSYRANQSSPVLEEFIPVKNSCSDQEPEKASLSSIDNKANWMTSVQLWSQASNTTTATVVDNTNHVKTTQNSTNQTETSLNTKQTDGGAFTPFSKERIPGSTPALVLPELALSSGEKDEENKKCVRENSSIKLGNGDVTDNQTTAMTTTATAAATGAASGSQTHRKTRRCWSPDLHRRFVNALQMLGGSQVATPKQIRELMKVDGLTNDEVKSHLQKYRLHTRRPSPSPQSTTNPAPQLVVLGGIWMPPEYATPTGAQTLYTTTTTHTTPHYITPQEFYPTPVLPPPPQPLLHHHHHNNNNGNIHNNQVHHHNIPMYKPSSQTTHSLQESSGRGTTTTGGTGNRSESIEDGKSESGGSWKAESGGETKVLMLREECEESNGSEVTLKF